jgi:hypothetical protein
MKNIINILALAAALMGLAITNTGCKTGGTNNTAHNIAETTLLTADTAMQAWAEYVVRREGEIAKLKLTDPDKAASQAHALLLNEGKVAAAFGNYQDAAQIAIKAAAASTNGSAPQLAGLAGPLIALITSLTQN